MDSKSHDSPVTNHLSRITCHESRITAYPASGTRAQLALSLDGMVRPESRAQIRQVIFRSSFNGPAPKRDGTKRVKMDSLRPRTINEYLRSISRRKAAIIVPALVIVISSAVAIKQLPNAYESSTFIIIDSPSGKGSGEDASLDLARRLATIRQQVTSRTRLEGIISKFGLYQNELQKGTRIDDVIEEMRSTIKVEVNSSRDNVTDAFTISYRANDPETARKVTAELSDQLIADNVQAMQSQVSGEADVLRQRAADLSSQLHELEEKASWLLSLKEDAPVVPTGSGGRGTVSAEALRAQQMTVENLKDQQYKLQQELADVERRISEQQHIVDQQKKTVNLRDNPTYAALIAKRTELKGQHDNLINSEELTDKHPRVIAINDQIAAIDQQIAELRRQMEGGTNQSPEMRDLRALESDRNRLKIELEVTGRELQRRIANPPVAAVSSAPAVPASPATRDAGAARMAQDYLGLKQTYKEVLAKLQDAELKKQTLGSDKVEQFRVLDQANLPQLPAWPNRRLLSLVAVALGLAVGAGFAFLLEMRSFTSLQDARDVEHYTRLPMLAAIPRTQTAEDRKRNERRARMRMALGTAVAIVATVALTKLLIVANLFALIGRK